MRKAIKSVEVWQNSRDKNSYFVRILADGFAKSPYKWIWKFNGFQPVSGKYFGRDLMYKIETMIEQIEHNPEVEDRLFWENKQKSHIPQDAIDHQIYHELRGGCE